MKCLTTKTTSPVKEQVIETVRLSEVVETV